MASRLDGGVTVSSEPSVDALTGKERGLSAVLGALSLVGAAVLLYCPPVTKQFPPQCAAPGCLTEMPISPMSLIVALMVVGVLLVVFALNGLRLLSLKVAGIETDLGGASESARRELAGKNTAGESNAASQPENTAPVAQPADTISIDGIDHELYALNDVPCRVMRDALDGVAKDPPDGAGEVPPGSLGRIQFIARRAGRGNHPWLLKFRDLDQTWKVSYGGQRKEEATVRPLS